MSFITYESEETVNNPPHHSTTNHAHCLALGWLWSQPSILLIHMFMAGFAPENIIAIASIAKYQWQ